MKKTMIPTWQLAAIAVCFSGTAFAGSDNKSHKGCDNGTLDGTYGIQMQGTRPSSPGGPIENVIGVVVRQYDGHGTFTQIDNVKGSISGITPDRPGSGTYQVDSDCSGVISLQPGPGVLVEERFVIVDNGSEIRSITASPLPIMMSTVQIKMK